MTSHTIIIGDSRHMDEVESESVDLVLTSPPYWNIKNYGTKQQIGYGQALEEYLKDMESVWKECYRILKPGTKLCINVGDQFLRTKIYGKYKVIPLHAYFISQCERMGFDYMGSIIWQKKTTMQTSGGANVMGSYPYPPNGVVEIDYEFIIIMKKPGKRQDITAERRKLSKLSKEEWKKYFSGHWIFRGERQKEHQAMFPEELPNRLIRMFSLKGDTVLDPFLGSGTTTKVAKELGRNSIGYEINENFIETIKDKVGYSDDNYFKIIRRETKGNFSKPGRSNIIENSNPQKYINKEYDNNLYRVKEVISPDKIRIDDGAEVGFIGVKVLAEKYDQVLEYLENFVKGKTIFLKFDPSFKGEGYKKEAYVYLKNKIFINKELIRKGFAEVADYEFSMKKLFLKIEKK